MQTALNDDELAALALAADPDTPMADGAIPFDRAVGLDELLVPGWYMPAPAEGCTRLEGWRRTVALVVVSAFLLLTAAGLCGTGF